MRKLGQLLLAEGAITPAQLDEALQSQVAFDGRLGTNLVELGHLTLDQLATYLADQQHVPLAPPDWLENIPTPALRSIPLDVVKRLRVLPLRIEGRSIHVVLHNPLSAQDLAEVA